jgi:hypothetical protein
MTSALKGGVWSAPRPGRFTPGKDPVPIVQESGLAPRPIWTCAKNLAPTGIWSPDRPAHSQSLYRLRYPGIYSNLKIKLKLNTLLQVQGIMHYLNFDILVILYFTKFPWGFKLKLAEWRLRDDGGGGDVLENKLKMWMAENQMQIKKANSNINKCNTQFKKFKKYE